VWFAQRASYSSNGYAHRVVTSSHREAKWGAPNPSTSEHYLQHRAHLIFVSPLCSQVQSAQLPFDLRSATSSASFSSADASTRGFKQILQARISRPVGEGVMRHWVSAHQSAQRDGGFS